MGELVKGSRQREQINDMIRVMENFQWDMHSRITAEAHFPTEWQIIWEARRKTKIPVSLRLEEDVVKFYKSMGPGYGPRMNDVLRTFMLARLSGLIQGQDLATKYRQDWMGKSRPSMAQAVAETRIAMGRDADDE